jgi:GrpB-like predicted nucleotidyltransferase (UPF0157 family)
MMRRARLSDFRQAGVELPAARARAAGHSAPYAAPPLPSRRPAMTDPVVVVPYDPAWPVRFRIESQLLHLALAALRPAIEHIGSTSVTGLAAKPVIDMLVGVPSLAAFEAHAARLSPYGYEYIPEYERALPERRFFKRVVRGVRTHHVHVVEVNGLYWKRYLRFRNHLRGDPWLAARYAELKRRLAGRHRHDRDAYTNGKTGFVEAVLAMPLTDAARVPFIGPAALQAA